MKRLALAIAAVAVLVFALAGCTPVAPPATRTITAQQFRDSIGINIHDTYADTAYGNWPAVLSSLRYVGFSRVRTSAIGSPDPAFDAWQHGHLADVIATGAKLDLTTDPRYSAATQIANTADLGAGVESIEGINEYGGDQGFLASYQTSIWSAGRPPLVVAPSKGGPQQDMTASYDWANLHDYTGGQSPAPQIIPWGDQPGAFWVKPYVATEFGFHNELAPVNGDQPGVSEATGAVYLLRQYLEHLASNVDRSYAYELVDERCGTHNTQDAYGLFRCDWTAKLGAIALHNLVQIVGTGTPQATTPLQYAVDGTDNLADVRTLDVQLADGTHDLILWRTTNVGAPTETVHVYGYFQTWVAYDPIISSAPQAFGPGGTGALPLGDNPIVLHITP